MAKISKNLDEVQELFNSLGLRFTMKAFRYCAEHQIDLNEFERFNPENLLNLVMLGTPNIKIEEAYEVIEKWSENGKYSLPMLHTLTRKEAYDSGFFINEADMKAMSEMETEKMDILKLLLPAVTQELAGLTNFQEGLRNSL